MYSINDYLIYQRKVCIVKEILNNYINDIDYYLLKPIDDTSLTIKIPVNSKGIRNLITKDEIDNLILEIPNIKTITTDNKLIENVYRNLLKEDNHKSLIKIIKTTYLRNKERENNNKNKSEKDDEYFSLAESYLYNELAIVLDKTYSDTKQYIINQVNKIIKTTPNN